MAALNRTFALARARGKEVAIAEAEKLALAGNHYYHTLLGELYRGIDNEKARAHFADAYALARTPADKRLLRQKLEDSELRGS